MFSRLASSVGRNPAHFQYHRPRLVSGRDGEADNFMATRRAWLANLSTRTHHQPWVWGWDMGMRIGEGIGMDWARMILDCAGLGWIVLYWGGLLCAEPVLLGYEEGRWTAGG